MFLEEYRKLTEEERKVIKAFLPIQDEYYYYEGYALNLLTGDVYKDYKEVVDVEEKERIIKRIEQRIEERIEEVLKQLGLLDSYLKQLEIINNY